MNQKQTRFVGNVLASGKRLFRLVENMILVMETGDGGGGVETEQIDVREFVAHAALRHSARAHGAGIALEIAVADGLPTLSADREKVSKVFDELLDNALTYTSEGGTVRITADRDTRGVGQPQERLRFTIADTGVGMRKSDLETVFDTFMRVETSLSRTTEGQGTRVIFVLPVDPGSSYNTGGAQFLKAALLMGASATLRKPFTVDALVTELERVCGT